MLIEYIVIALSMACKDTAYSACTGMIATGHKFLASTFDVLGDISTLFSVVGAGVLVAKYGFSPPSLFAIMALTVGSYVGTYAGVTISQWVERHARVQVEPPIHRGS